MPAGYWCPVLHAHLPYVRHPEHPSFLEEDWSWAIEKKRTRDHVARFDYLYRALSGQCRLEEPILREFDRVYR